MSKLTPLYSALVQHHRLGRSAFHTPGHSGKPDFSIESFTAIGCN